MYSVWIHNVPQSDSIVTYLAFAPILLFLLLKTETSSVFVQKSQAVIFSICLWNDISKGCRTNFINSFSILKSNAKKKNVETQHPSSMSSKDLFLFVSV